MAVETSDPLRELIEALEPDERDRNAPLIRCQFCTAPVTRQSAQTAVDGAHRHRFTNPHGFRYTIVCYREAPGCALHGEPVAEFTWFPGYSWQLALCGSCQEHLGWYYQRHQHFFYGLIADKLLFPSPRDAD